MWTEELVDRLQARFKEGTPVEPGDYPGMHIHCSLSRYAYILLVSFVLSYNSGRFEMLTITQPAILVCEFTNVFAGACTDVKLALELVGVKDKAVFVLGAISPWIETIALGMGASKTVTVDYNTPMILGKAQVQMATLPIQTALKQLDQWQLLVSFSSLEHDGDAEC